MLEDSARDEEDAKPNWIRQLSIDAASTAGKVHLFQSSDTLECC